jgi:hypothetical protein
VWVLTKETYLRKKPWRRDLLEDVFAEPDDTPLAHTMNTVELPGPHASASTASSPSTTWRSTPPRGSASTCASQAWARPAPGVFRDKLAMRIRAQEEGIPVPDFVGVLHHDDDPCAFTERVPAPWMLKPRTEASSTGIQKIESSRAAVVGDRGARRPGLALPARALPARGPCYHVDSIVIEGKVVFVEVHRNGVPPFDVSHGGGVFSTTSRWSAGRRMSRRSWS